MDGKVIRPMKTNLKVKTRTTVGKTGVMLIGLGKAKKSNLRKYGLLILCQSTFFFRRKQWNYLCGWCISKQTRT